MNPQTAKSNRAAVPSVDRILQHPAVALLVAEHGRQLVTQGVRVVLNGLRAALADTAAEASSHTDPDAIAQQIRDWLTDYLHASLTRVFNLTGTVLHTNLGRAPLPREAIDAMVAVSSGAANLEYDLETGRRGDRDAHVEAWVCRLTGAQAATVVNNNAAAVLLLLNTLARRKEVPVSRGELIEIGGAFRIPDIMARAGCKLVEVGTTNRTHARDFEAALSPRTALLMKVHTSNYVVQGFTADVPAPTLAALARNHDCPLIVDLGSGTLVDLEQFGLPHEPTVRETLAAGADLVTFSGDKLLGGPQAGIIAGRADLIARIKKNPMKRAMRCDKMTIAALGAVLALYANPETLAQRIPAIRLLARPEADIAAQAARLLPALQAALGDRVEVEITEVKSQIGSGAMPVDLLPSAALAMRTRSAAALNRLAAAFRALPVPVIGRIHAGIFLLDLRCLDDEDGFCAQLVALPQTMADQR